MLRILGNSFEHFGNKGQYHIHSIDQTEAIKTIKRKITDLDKMKIEEQKKAVRSGYDMDIIPSDLATFGSEAKNLLQDLQSRNERMFLLTFLVVNMADTKRKLENDVFAAAGIAQKNNCALTRLDYQQEAGLMSSVPLGENLIAIQRGLTTSSTAIFIPFITQELFQTGAALYYGLNALSNNMILCDRKQLKNPNGLILGTPGSGKSFAAKREMTNAFLITDDDIIICDPEAEYFSLVQRLDGQVIRLSPTGKGIDGKLQYVNPMDINLNYSEDDSPLALKSDFILSLCELVIGGKEGLQPVDKTVIDRAVRNVYRPFLADPDPEKMPILGDLYDELLKQPEPEAARIAAALELYVSGSLNVFNHRTNVELSNRLVCFDIKQLGKQLKKLGILYIQYDSDGKPTLCADCRDLPARLDKALWSVRQAAILTSGTLSAGGNFTHTVQRIGLNNPQTFRAESPFDYKRNCILYFPKRTSTPFDEVEWLSQEIEQLVQVCHGHALVLFTSYDQMGRVQQRLQGRVAYPLLTARRNGQLFVQAFKQLSNAVLFAAGPCWEGVDFPGDRVSLLIIIRLPFPVPDPVSDAEKAKYPDLHSYIQAEVIPTMQKKLRQGFGRAIRTETDTCTVAILDPRAAPGGRYHRAALDALPKMNMTQDIKDVEHFIRAVKGAEYFFA